METKLSIAKFKISKSKFFEDPSYLLIREDAYSRTGGIFIRDTARDTAYSLWFNEA